MNISLDSHENGCTPFKRCRSCAVVDFLKEKLSSSTFETFAELYITDGLDFGTHKDGCTPLVPCSNCRATEILKTKLGKDNLSGKDFFQAFIHMYTSPIPLEMNEKLMMRISEFNLSVRTDTCLKNDNILRIGDLVTKTEVEMGRIPGFGRKSLNEIKEVLGSMGLRLGMNVPGWPPEPAT